MNDFTKVTEKSVAYRFTDRRAGDIASCYAIADKAKALLGLKTRRSITEMYRDTWYWQSRNSDRYL